MADRTKIEWTEATWNPITGCSVVSAGCKHCYAMKLAGTRLQHHPSRAGLTIDTAAGPVWNGQVRFNEQWLDQPLRWRRPRLIFVCAHSDLFHESVPDEWIDRVFAIMALAPHHTFQVLTKRPERMLRYFTERRDEGWSDGHIRLLFGRPARAFPASFKRLPLNNDARMPWPLPNVWLGVSVENQDAADERIPLLLQTPASVRWISAEPLLGPVDLTRVMRSESEWTFCDNALTGFRAHKCGGTIGPKLDWVVAGGESGTGARPMHPDWARSLRDQCAEAGVAFLHKQNGNWANPDDIEAAGLASHGWWEEDRTDGGVRRHEWPDSKFPCMRTEVFCVGKKAAGRLLDGVLHDAYPEVRRG
jgi:protein gp37